MKKVLDTSLRWYIMVSVINLQLKDHCEYLAEIYLNNFLVFFPQKNCQPFFVDDHLVFDSHDVCDKQEPIKCNKNK